MSPQEIELANRGGRGFTDLCDDVRRTKVAHLHAIKVVDQAQARLKAAKDARDAAIDAEDVAMDALEAFIARECAISEAQP